MELRTVGIVGYGSFGSLVRELLSKFAPSVEVRVYSRKHKPDGKTFFPLEQVAQCDAVVPAVPIAAFEATVKMLLPLMREDTVIVDIATVKVHTVKTLKRLAKGRRWIATHPMWGPESYEKKGRSVAGLRIVVCEHTLPKAAYAEAKQALSKLGFDMVEMTAKRHDKHLAETLFLTHFVGQIVHRAGFDRTAIDTVSFGFLMDAVESVKHDTKLFRDVFEYNPYCKEVTKRFELSEKQVRDILADK
jgi:prephenate dehydrogenase